MIRPAALCLLMALAPLLAGCLPQTERADRDTTFIVAKAAAPLSLDPAVYATANDYPVQELVYEQLVSLNAESPDGVAPELARSWRFSGDGLTLDMQLFEDRVFESGAPIDAEAVVFSLNRVVELSRWSSVYLAWLDSVEATGPFSVRLTLERPYQPALQLLAQAAASIVDPSVVRDHLGEDAGIGFLSAHSAGSGPYRVAEITLDGTVVLEPNPMASPPRHFTRVEFRPIPDEGVRRLLLERGDIDFTDLVPSAFLDRYAALPGVDVLRGPAGSSLSYLTLNTRNGPLADVRMRQAVLAAIDYAGLRDQVLKGNASQLPGYLPPASPGFDPDEAPPRRNLDRARALIEAAGYRGEEIGLVTYQIGPVGEFLQASLREAGLNVRMVRRDAGAVDQMKREGRFDMIYEGWLVDGPNPAPMLEALFASRNIPGGLNASGLDDPELDELIDRALATQDSDERAAVLAEIDARLREEVPVAMVFSADPLAAFRDALQGIRIDPFKPYYQPVHTYAAAGGGPTE